MPPVPASWNGLEAAAKATVSANAFAYVAGSAGREKTADANSGAFESWRIMPRMLRDVSHRDLSERIAENDAPYSTEGNSASG